MVTVIVSGNGIWNGWLLFWKHCLFNDDTLPKPMFNRFSGFAYIAFYYLISRCLFYLANSNVWDVFMVKCWDKTATVYKVEILTNVTRLVHRLIITMDYTDMCIESNYSLCCANHACQVMVPLVLCLNHVISPWHSVMGCRLWEPHR